MKKKFLIDAFIKTVFFAGCLHLVILTFAAISRGTYEELNFFNFLDVQVLYPESIKGFGMFVISYVFFLCVFMVVYALSNRKKKS